MSEIKSYLVLVSSIDGKAKISETLMRTAKRMLGPERTPLAAWPTGFVIAFQSAEPAEATCERLKREMGQWFRIGVMELGANIADSSVVPEHRVWMEKLRRSGI